VIDAADFASKGQVGHRPLIGTGSILMAQKTQQPTMGMSKAGGDATPSFPPKLMSPQTAM